MIIKVVLTEWQVPFDQVVTDVVEFAGDTAEQDAVNLVNQASRTWWDNNEGDRCVVAYPDTQPYEPVKELGYDNARYELWGGENGFHAILTQGAYAELHEAHYKREFDDKGLKRPGYLRVAQGEDVSAELAELSAFYSPH